jgi:hypothetical protein
MPFDRRRFLLSSAAAAVSARLTHAAGPAQSLILLDPASADRARDFAKRERAPVIEKLAQSALAAGPWSVTAHRPTGLGVNAGPHDYVSEGPYWWPDPNNPTGPYIRHDGKRNPNRFVDNRNDLGKMTDAVLALGMGAFFLGNKACASHANRVLATWFVDEATRMNPNLEHGQMVRGHNTGRGTGIIDTVGMIYAVQGAALLEAAGGLDAAVVAVVRQWFADYLQWMTTSQYGKDEKESGNNHATWWTAQAASFALFTGNTAAQAMCWSHYRDYLVPTEIEPDGSCPREEERTDSLSYSSMNLDAFATVCRLAQINGVDLWHYRTAKGIGVERSFPYLIPFVEHPDRWKKSQSGQYNAGGYIFPGLAGAGLPSSALLASYLALPRSAGPWIQFVDIVIRSAGAARG